MRVVLLRAFLFVAVVGLSVAGGATNLAAANVASPSQPIACVAQVSAAQWSAFLQVDKAAAADSSGAVTLMVCIVAAGQREGIAGYHGELRFDPVATELLSVERVSGGARLEITSDSGRLIFAGVSADGFVEPVVLRAVMRPLDAKRGLPPIELLIHELSSVSGADLSRRVAVTGYSGLLPRSDQSPPGLTPS